MTDGAKRNEQDCIYQFEIDVQHLNENQCMKFSSYQNLFARLAERHLNDYDANFDQTIKHGMAWAIVSLSIEVVKPIDSCIRLYGSTWFSQRKGPYFRRELLFKDAEGQIRFQGTTHSVLLDINNRSVFRKKELPFPLTAPIEDFTIKASPHFRQDLTFTAVEQRKVRGSYLDCLGHVNNCRYGDFAYDALSEEERALTGDLSRMDIFFLAELRDKDLFTIQRATEEQTLPHALSDQSICFQGYNDTKGEVSFTILLEYFKHH
ncbi:MAG: thioesterase [Eubacteriales bacterium]|nr:thioesterase [Eubacteriales bacterium]MDD3349628.1 thioesterase [Eubacteriales bacterium]